VTKVKVSAPTNPKLSVTTRNGIPGLNPVFIDPVTNDSIARLNILYANVANAQTGDTLMYDSNTSVFNLAPLDEHIANVISSNTALFSNLILQVLASNTLTINTISVTTIQANGSPGANGQVLYSNGTGVYWGNHGVMSVNTSNGLSGGPITDTGTIGLVVGPSLTVNNSGLYVNATLSIQDLSLSGNVTGFDTIDCGSYA